jgi:hypothetical protein
LVGQIETNYAGADAANLGQVQALDPVNRLRALAERIGRSTDTWNKAWEGVEALDKEGSLLQSHFNVLIAGIGQLPDGATLSNPDESSDGAAVLHFYYCHACPVMRTQSLYTIVSIVHRHKHWWDVCIAFFRHGACVQVPSRSSLVQKAAELHSLLDKCFDGKVSVHTFNALLSVFCRSASASASVLLFLLEEHLAQSLLVCASIQ